ncbi:DNA mismatch repair protein PMS1 [Platanthera zijinensis]|uniref:DNA mismatch repair protein PMS1 n=1 Tax=Platanthera zijinensis TaxID=2320716 RepID=A0AAP0B2Q5_9ASPA
MEGQANFPVITAMDKSVAHKICSGQVILDLSSAVKELVENSLDAGASNIEISLKEHGEDFFKVIDNGCGISPDNFQVLAKKYHTSKITYFSDLHCLTTFGFRGEALSSLCSLGSLTVETRTKNEEVGTHLTFDHSGSVIAERKTARQVGTTVSVEKLFSTLPVRSKEFSRNVRREYGKLTTLLNAYAIMAKGVRFLCTNITSKNSKSVVLKTQGNNSVKENVIAVLGLNTFQCLEPLSINVSACCTVEGFLSKPGYGSGRNMGDRQFFYINGRPVDMPKVGKLLNEVYKGSNSKQYPIAIMNFIMPATSYDVNVTPDKRKVFMTDEGSLILSLRAEIEKVYSPHQCSYSINTMNSSKEVDISLQDDIEAEDSQGPSVMFKSFSPKYGQIVTDGSAEHEIDDVSAKDLKISNMDIDLGTEYNIDDFTSPGIPFMKTDEERSMFLNHCSQLKKSKYIKLNTTVIDEVPSSSDKKDTYSYSNLVQSPLQRFLPVYKRKHDNSCNMLSEMPLLRDGSNSRQIRKTGTENIPVSRTKFSESKDEVADADKSDHHHEAYNASNKVKTFCSSELKTCDRHSKKDNSEVHDSDFYISEAVQEAVPEKYMDIKSGSPTLSPSLKAHDKNSIMIKTCSDQQIYPLLQFSMYDLKKRRDKRVSCLLTGNFEAKGRNPSCYFAATLANSHLGNDDAKTESLAAAAVELERFFRKEDFGRMEIDDIHARKVCQQRVLLCL